MSKVAETNFTIWFSQDKEQVHHKYYHVLCSSGRSGCVVLCLTPVGHSVSAAIWRNCPALSTEQNTIRLQYGSPFPLPKYIIDFQHFMLQLLPQSRPRQVPISNASSLKVKKEWSEQAMIHLQLLLGGVFCLPTSPVSLPLTHLPLVWEKRQRT